MIIICNNYKLQTLVLLFWLFSKMTLNGFNEDRKQLLVRFKSLSSGM